jgi:hypothetical protein
LSLLNINDIQNNIIMLGLLGTSIGVPDDALDGRGDSVLMA